MSDVSEEFLSYTDQEGDASGFLYDLADAEGKIAYLRVDHLTNYREAREMETNRPAPHLHSATETFRSMVAEMKEAGTDTRIIELEIGGMASMKSVFWNRGESRLRAGWRLVGQFAFFSIFIVIGFIFDDLVAGPLPRSPAGVDESILFPIELLLSSILSVWIAGRFLDRRRFVDFGLRFSALWWRDLGFGLALGAVLMTGIFLIQLGAGWVTVTGAFRSGMREFAFPVEVLVVLVSLACLAVLAEFQTRGYMLKNMAEGLNHQSWGPRGAIVLAALVSAMFFGLLHYDPQAGMISILALVPAGLLYATAYVLTGELAIPIGFHFRSRSARVGQCQ